MNQKKAFTVAEMLIVLGILGILMALGITIMHPEERGRRVHISTILSSLDSAMYNAYQFDDSKVFDKDNVTQDKSSEELCKALAVHKDNNNNVGYINNTKRACKADAMPLPTSTTGDSNFSTANREKYLKFTTTTGMDVFISNRYNEESDGLYFYLIYVDINGKKGPNTLVYKEPSGLVPQQYPDIYVFAAISIGRVIPLGRLETDEKLLTAHANRLGEDTSDYNDTKYGQLLSIGESTSYAKAKSHAWGFYTSNATMPQQGVPALPGSGQTNNEQPQNPVETDITLRRDSMGYDDKTQMFEEPYAYNDAIRNYLKDSNSSTTIPFIEDMDTLSNNEEFKCEGVTVDDAYYNGSCGVEIDTYSY